MRRSGDRNENIMHIRMLNCIGNATRRVIEGGKYNDKMN